MSFEFQRIMCILHPIEFELRVRKPGLNLAGVHLWHEGLSICMDGNFRLRDYNGGFACYDAFAVEIDSTVYIWLIERWVSIK